MHPTMKARLANLIRHNDSRAITALLLATDDPHERQSIRLAAQHVERSRRHRERHSAGTPIDLTSGR